MSDIRLGEKQKIGALLNSESLVPKIKEESPVSLWQKNDFAKDLGMKGLFIEKSETSFSIINNTPVDKRELAEFIEELGTATAWADDFAKGIKTKNDLMILKEFHTLKNTEGERLYDNFQIFQFTGENGTKKLELAKRFLLENPEFSNAKYNGYLINYMAENKVSKELEDNIIRNADLAQKTIATEGIATTPERLSQALFAVQM